MDYNEMMLIFLAQLGGEGVAHRLEGRKFDKIVVNGIIKYYVARNQDTRCDVGDIFGAKSNIAPNFRWYYGKLENCQKWDWTGAQPVPVDDKTVLAVKKYRDYVHYVKLPSQ